MCHNLGLGQSRFRQLFHEEIDNQRDYDEINESANEMSNTQLDRFQNPHGVSLRTPQNEEDDDGHQNIAD